MPRAQPAGHIRHHPERWRNSFGGKHIGVNKRPGSYPVRLRDLPNKGRLTLRNARSSTLVGPRWEGWEIIVSQVEEHMIALDADGMVGEETLDHTREVRPDGSLA